MKLYNVKDEYIGYLRKYVSNVYDNKENSRVHSRKYLGIILKVSDFYYYVPMSSPKQNDYDENGEIRKSVPTIVRIVTPNDNSKEFVLKGTLRISNMIPVPLSEVIEYDIENEKDKQYKDLVEKEMEFIRKNEVLILRYANTIYMQQVKKVKKAYQKSLLDYKYLEELCVKYEREKH